VLGLASSCGPLSCVRCRTVCEGLSLPILRGVTLGGSVTHARCLPRRFACCLQSLPMSVWCLCSLWGCAGDALGDECDPDIDEYVPQWGGRVLLSILLRSHSIRFTGAQGVTSTVSGWGGGKDGRVGVHGRLQPPPQKLLKREQGSAVNELGPLSLGSGTRSLFHSTVCALCCAEMVCSTLTTTARQWPMWIRWGFRHIRSPCLARVTSSPEFPKLWRGLKCGEGGGWVYRA
jgi:hypothetical protein